MHVAASASFGWGEICACNMCKDNVAGGHVHGMEVHGNSQVVELTQGVELCSRECSIKSIATQQPVEQRKEA